ncbi:ATP-binding protein [Actinoplanes sp. NPDC023801]|uniref:ATP-binding protein n=1 Tax=Actinoplanes sp. NPDC023801 TaxID=3154595 RepID=UPI0033D4B805
MITQACLQWQLPSLLASAALVASELVTNAVRHAGTMIDLHVVRGRQHLIIQVIDGSPHRPMMPDPLTVMRSLTSPGFSRGLILVDATADRWGCWPVRDGKMTWAALRSAP